MKSFLHNLKTVGIVGGGQLGRMMLPAIKKFGLSAAVLDPDASAPCSGIADIHITAGFNDKQGFLDLAQVSDVITYEFEHIDVQLLALLQDKGHTIFPSVESLKIIQDKYTQRLALKEAGVAQPAFCDIKDFNALQAYFNQIKKPLMVKSRRGGYDGKGNYPVKSMDCLQKAFDSLYSGGENDLMAEEYFDFTKEVSVIASRGQNGECVFYPIAENVHKNSILDVTTVPARMSDSMQEKVLGEAKKVMECFGGVGTFCTEFFINENSGAVLVNEVAPRVHNSGHYTIEACVTSQFENHIRAICALPLGSTEMVVGAAAMKNIVGVSKHGAYTSTGYYGVEQALSVSGTSVHLYGKSHIKPGRKMGHVTVTGNNADEVNQKLSLINIHAIE
ncbi:MAG: 5-(carboxyamino)imidazole ribonucleotide synthase [Firmicutes bacterium]|nr:5-(carboxyamino)imidazole ribonucleotide synthase [Bacillota bacterium]